MLSQLNRERLASLVKDRNTTQASMVNKLVEFALDHAPLDDMEFAPSKPRGRPKKEKAESSDGEAQSTPEMREESHGCADCPGCSDGECHP